MLSDLEATEVSDLLDGSNSCTIPLVMSYLSSFFSNVPLIAFLEMSNLQAI
jgi:hypothetical protein